MRQLFLISCFLVTLLQSAAQQSLDKAQLKQVRDLVKQAEKHAGVGGIQYDDAIALYEQAQAIAPDDIEVNLQLGLCHLNSGQRHASLPYFEKVAQLAPDMPRIHFLVGFARQLNARWDEAIEAYEMHKQAGRGFADENPLFNTADRRIVECRNGHSLMAEPKPWKVENMGRHINASAADHGVLVTADGERMLFTSRRPEGASPRINKTTNDYFENIYESQLRDGRWTEPRMLPQPVNTDGNDAAVGLFNDGRTLLLYRDNQGAGDIWETKRTGDSWSEPTKLGPNINTEAHESSAWFSFDRQWLYFVSDREEDNVGGQDIYRSRWDEAANDWGPAENLGPDVNSPYDEDGVFVHPDGRTIYFSSKGHNSMGGYDIFRTSLGEDGRWTRPENLGWPINSPDDDLFFMLTADGTTGYFSSIRAGGHGEDDIYRVDLTVDEKQGYVVSAAGGAPVAEAALGHATVLLKGQVKVKDLHMLAGMEAYIELMDLEDASLVARFKSDAETGEYMAAVPGGREYAMYVKADGFILHSENISVPGVGRSSQMDMDIVLNTLEVGSEVVMKNIFFDTNRSDLKPASTAEMNQLIGLLESVPGLQLEVSGHTDSVGSRELNQRLSEQRALSVKRYLVERGIEASRLQHKGYGPDKPIAGNDDEDGRAKNRRTEIRIIGR